MAETATQERIVERRRRDRRQLDRRRHQRIPVNIMVDVYSPDKNRACVMDISLGGVALETCASMEIGTEIHMHIKLNPFTVDVSGKIIRKRSLMDDLNEYGVRYTGLGFFKKLKLKRYINNWLKMRESLDVV